jgi:hypothetical protein
LTRDYLFNIVEPYRPIESIKYENYSTDWGSITIRAAFRRKSRMVNYYYFDIAQGLTDGDSRITGARIRSLLMYEIGQIIFKWQDDLLVLNRWARRIDLPECLQKHIGLHINHDVPDEEFEISQNHFLLCCSDANVNLDDAIILRPDEQHASSWVGQGTA